MHINTIIIINMMRIILPTYNEFIYYQLQLSIISINYCLLIYQSE